MKLTDNLVTRLDTFGTALCSALSLIGSLMVIISFLLVKTTSTKPRAARLILNLAMTDCLWFSASLIQALFWVFTGDYGDPGKVPVGVCYVCSPLVTLSRLSSLLWTCVIAFEAVQACSKRKWLTEVEESRYYDYAYFAFVYVFAIPGALLAIIKQHTGEHSLGCEPDYEKLGKWYEVMFTELIPIAIGFSINVYAFFQVRKCMSSRAFPRSVRKRRKRVMYHYIVVCMLCWAPTIAFYILEICGIHSPLLEVLSRILLYTTGFFNFLVFGMQDPHLNRSFRRAMQLMGLGFCVGVTADTNLRRSSREKTVMFENAEKTNADISKDKRTVYRYRRLSREDKALLYESRPDLNIKDHGGMKEPLLNSRQRRAARGPCIVDRTDGKMISRTVPLDRTAEQDPKREVKFANCSAPRSNDKHPKTSDVAFSNNQENEAISTASDDEYFDARDDIPTAQSFQSREGGSATTGVNDVESAQTKDGVPVESIYTPHVPLDQRESVLQQGGRGSDISVRSVASERDSIFNADNEDEDSSSEDDEEDAETDLVGSLLSWVF
mmetsp:Transcript_7626/g.11307  ORF Transcript_7626/g.11307 Transcript_7626/m.11307 type:complete len:552 (+) Transcript_7626:187-1842(+)